MMLFYLFVGVCLIAAGILWGIKDDDTFAVTPGSLAAWAIAAVFLFGGLTT
jgi:hypothetical protein